MFLKNDRVMEGIKEKRAQSRGYTINQRKVNVSFDNSKKVHTDKNMVCAKVRHVIRLSQLKLLEKYKGILGLGFGRMPIPN